VLGANAPAGPDEPEVGGTVAVFLLELPQPAATAATTARVTTPVQAVRARLTSRVLSLIGDMKRRLR
jgi:hypothetical protein